VTKSILFVSVVSLLIAAAHPAPAEQPSPAPVLTARLYNFGGIPATTLERATKVADRVYAKAGIETKWMKCHTGTGEQLRNPACQETPGPNVLRVRLLSKSMTARVKVNRHVFGFAAPSKTGGFGVIANIFRHRVVQLARDRQHSEELILGHVLAHEIGHLLLGGGGHSKRGIMRLHWGESDLAEAAIGQLVFTRKQVKKILEQVEARERRPSHAGPFRRRRAVAQRGGHAERLLRVV
jgi:hypothetical protein